MTEKRSVALNVQCASAPSWMACHMEKVKRFTACQMNAKVGKL